MATRWRWNPVEIVTGEGLCVFITEQDAAWQRPLLYFCAGLKQMVVYCLCVTAAEACRVWVLVQVFYCVDSDNVLYITVRGVSLPPLPVPFPSLSPPVVTFTSGAIHLSEQANGSDTAGEQGFFFSPFFFLFWGGGATVFKTSRRQGK